MDGKDPFQLQRFVEAQDREFKTALAELEAGRKQSHWMWFIFPQHRDLGRSSTARFFGLSGTEEARAYAMHPLLGRRLRTCCLAILPHLEAGRSAEAVLGTVDALKLRSSMTLFAEADPAEPIYAAVLAASAA